MLSSLCLGTLMPLTPSSCAFKADICPQWEAHIPWLTSGLTPFQHSLWLLKFTQISNLLHSWPISMLCTVLPVHPTLPSLASLVSPPFPGPQTPYLQNEHVDLSGVLLLPVDFPGAFTLLPKTVPSISKDTPCGSYQPLDSCCLQSVWVLPPWRKPFFSWCKLYSRWLQKTKLRFVIFHINRRQNFLKIKAVENEKNNSAFRSWEGGAGYEDLHWRKDGMNTSWESFFMCVPFPASLGNLWGSVRWPTRQGLCQCAFTPCYYQGRG